MFHSNFYGEISIERETIQTYTCLGRVAFIWADNAIVVEEAVYLRAPPLLLLLVHPIRRLINMLHIALG